MIRKSLSKINYNQFKSIVKLKNLRFYDTLNSSQYLSNYSRALASKTWQMKRLKPLVQANHRADDNLLLYSIPMYPLNDKAQLYRCNNYLNIIFIPENFQKIEALIQHQPDLIFVQYDPMPFISRQRYMSQKCAMNGVQGYQLNSVKQLQKPHPHTWQEAVVNLIILDMLHANQVHTKIDYTKGFSTYSYPQIQQQRVSDNLQEKFIQSITDHIIADNWSRYYDINQYIFIALMSKQKVILGDMPEILLRQILGNTLTLQQVKDIFKFVLQNIRKNLQAQNGVGNLKNTMANVTCQLFSHVFLQPRDLYISAMLKKVMMAANNTVAFIGSPHFFPVQEYWKPPPYGVNFTQATKIPKKIVNQTPEDLIQKQAIFQILLDTRVWGQKYITNAFPYLVDDITLLSQKEHKHFKKMFFINYKKYEAFRDQVLPRGVVDQITSDFMATIPKGDQGLVVQENRIS